MYGLIKKSSTLAASVLALFFTVACSQSSGPKNSHLAIDDARTSYSTCVRRLTQYGRQSACSTDVYGYQAMSMYNFISYYYGYQNNQYAQYDSQVVGAYFSYLSGFSEQEIRGMISGGASAGWNYIQ